MNQPIIHMISAPQNAGQKPSTKNPFTTVEANQNINAFITSVNNPKVKIFIGNVNKSNKGRIKALTKPKTKAATKAE